MTYKESGVDIDSGNDLISAIIPTANSTKRSGIISTLGDFGAMFDLKSAGYKDPILVAGTDGVGTKLLIAGKMNQHESIGIDLVAMCANDLVVMGAEPLFFLDYFATGKLDVGAAQVIIGSIAEGCRYAGCALIGGETAEMPGMYSAQKYDLAGFCVGAVERNHELTGEDVKEGDVILGLDSTGLHSNGFSLVRHIIENSGHEYEMPAPFAPGLTLGQALLAPTRIYVKSCLSAIQNGGVHALAHITGGGLIENLPRVIPNGLSARINGSAWTIPNIFHWISTEGNVSSEEMFRTFNCGIGMVAIVSPDKTEKLKHVFNEHGDIVRTIGTIVSCDNGNSISIDKQDVLWRK